MCPVAGGRFAPGHLGELTAVVPFELVDAVLAETRTVQQRLRDLPSRVGVYFLLAMCLFPEVGYRLVRDRLTAARLRRRGIQAAEQRREMHQRPQLPAQEPARRHRARERSGLTTGDVQTYRPGQNREYADTSARIRTCPPSACGSGISQTVSADGSPYSL
ncbi:transposase domain-containing protein [Streptomyces sp. NY05-11A]|nr:transposase domain-containing protein [Streptomyces sp. NY05-11A]MDX2683078.1 transposase domain-containing protein [Streptomyces sp. NY05-11A]